jgi:NAD(P)-dependent dehydrogenase (short-subunit alcohol dehydrogenase family)
MTRRTVVINGAGGALGGALAGFFAHEPDTDVVLSDVSAPALDATVAGLGEVEATVEHLLADVSDIEQVEAVMARAAERFGHIDAVISNAGVLSPNGRIHNLTTEDWERAFQVNVLGAVNAIRAAVPVMRTQHSGSIVLTASVSGLTAWSHAAPYCATKAAVIQLAKVAAVEYAPRRDPGQLRLPRFVPVCDPRRPPRGGHRRHRIATPARSGHRRRSDRRVRLPRERRVALADRFGRCRRRRILRALSQGAPTLSAVPTSAAGRKRSAPVLP